MNLRDIEQGMDQINRLRSNQAVINLLPDPKKLGGTILEIKNTIDKTGSVSMRYDNYSQPQVPLYPLNFTISKDNLWHINDQWWITFSQGHTGQQQFNSSGAIDVSIPFGYATWGLNFSLYDYALITKGINNDIFSSGQTKSGGASLDYGLYRNAYSKTNFNASFSIKESVSFLQDVQLDNQTQKYQVLRLGLSELIYGSWGTVSVSPAFLKGWKDNQPFFEKAIFSLSYSQTLSYRLGIGINLSSSGQWVDRSLPSSEKIGIGDYSSVRGFVDTLYTGDTGVTSKMEFNLKLGRLYQFLMPCSVFIDFDYGWVQSKQENTASALLGSAMGLRYAAGLVSADFVLTKGLWASREAIFQSDRVYSGLTLSF